jgi:hypothetical protein
MIEPQMILADGQQPCCIHFEQNCVIACAPLREQRSSLPTRPDPCLCTPDVRVVTCPLCKETPQYQAALAALLAIAGMIYA